jgi:hypothetical protein
LLKLISKKKKKNFSSGKESTEEIGKERTWNSLWIDISSLDFMWETKSGKMTALEKRCQLF